MDTIKIPDLFSLSNTEYLFYIIQTYLSECINIFLTDPKTCVTTLIMTTLAIWAIALVIKVDLTKPKVT
ncbi:unnamed protein product [Moneuplotes crassus]|uniref:Uncharacterized protein n=1 Tax=Euplotes crassus TaxID=5936 RepID=A0AAD2D9T6_EUPCR|nr:unnamed protein product [Moneuplotes crassus]